MNLSGATQLTFLVPDPFTILVSSGQLKEESTGNDVGYASE